MNLIWRTLSPPPPDVALRTRWYISIRWPVLTIISVPGILSLFVNSGWSTEVQHDSMLFVSAIVSNGIFYLLARRRKKLTYYQILSNVLLITDILIISSLIYIKGGIESRSVILYAIPILMAAAIFGRRSVYLTSIACAVAYDSIIIGDYLGLIHSLDAYNPELRTMLPYVVNTVVFFTIILLIIGATVDFINKLLVEHQNSAVESLKAMQLAQAVARLGSWEWDVNKNVFQWPKALNDIFGVSVPEDNAIAGEISRIIHHDDRENVIDEFRLASEQSRTFSVEHRIISSGGRIRYALTEGKSIPNRKGKIIRVIGTTRDITDSKVLDTAKRDFVSLASHQLRTPATGVKQYLGMLRENHAGKLTTKQMRLLEIAYESNERQLAIVDDLLHVAQIDSDKLMLHAARVRLIPLIQKAIAEQTPKFEAKQQMITFSSNHPAITIQLDKQRFRMALDNIIDNASKYSPDNSIVEVNVEDGASQVKITVSDQGVGIAKSDVGKLFQKFSRVDNPVSTVVGGTGLGLYLASRVISLHGGKIDVKSQVGKGTAFTMTLPKIIAPAANDPNS